MGSGQSERHPGGFLFYEKLINFVRSRAGAEFADSLVPAGEPAPDLLLPRDESGTPWMFHCCDVRDIVQGLTLLLDRPEAVGQAFNLAGPAPFSYGELIPYLAEQANLTYLDATIPGQPLRIHHSIAKARGSTCSAMTPGTTSSPRSRMVSPRRSRQQRRDDSAQRQES